MDVSTQMNRPGCYMSCCLDRLLFSGAYMTADEYLERRLRAVSALLLLSNQVVSCVGVGPAMITLLEEPRPPLPRDRGGRGLLSCCRPCR